MSGSEQKLGSGVRQQAKANISVCADRLRQRGFVFIRVITDY
jgi:hypothetical protein